MLEGFSLVYAPDYEKIKGSPDNFSLSYRLFLLSELFLLGMLNRIPYFIPCTLGY